MRVCLGGTFDHLHKGHERLLLKALEIAGDHGTLFIGIATGPLLTHKAQIQPFHQRKQQIIQFLACQSIHPELIIRQIRTEYGPTLTMNFDVIIISPETKPTAKKINNKREQRGLKPMTIIEIPFVLADDGDPISSTRIRHKEIDTYGHLRKQQGD